MFPRSEEPSPVTEQEALLSGAKVRLALETAPVDKEVVFLWESCLAEVEKGFCDPPRTAEEMDNLFGEKGWCCVPAFCHVQPCGKRRRIDDAKRGGVRI